jgi:glutamine synthetase
LTLAAGLEGIRLGLDPGDPVNLDTYKLSEEEQRAVGLHRLPGTLGEAIDEFERDELARQVFGDPFHASFVSLKRSEWEAYNTVVGDWERDQYLHLW